MPSDAARLPLGDIVRYAELASEFADGLEFEGSRRRSSNLSDGYSLPRSRVGGVATVACRVQGAASGIDWRIIAALGNVYRHEYESVDLRLAWLTVSDHLPALKVVAEAELRRLDAADG